MRLLLDTQIFLWWDRQLQRVPRELRAAIEDTSNRIFVSTASVWEIAIKRAVGKFSFPAPIVETVAALGFEVSPITGAHAEYAGGLPRRHNDPFDRLIIAQAMIEGMVLGTQDEAMRAYAVPTLGL